MVVLSNDLAIKTLLSCHPRISQVLPSPKSGLVFGESLERQVLVAEPRTKLFGLTELTDNNPLVCADEFSVPSAAATLALIALGPLARAGLIAESPAVLANIPIDEADIDASLMSAGWAHGASCQMEPVDLDGVAVATALAVASNPVSEEDLHDLFDEWFSRTFYIRRVEDEDWLPEAVRKKPYAIFNVTIHLDPSGGLIRVRAMADLNGKCGAAQVVHAFNVMCGFEESLGVS